MKKLFSERQGAIKPRVAEKLDARTRGALMNLVSSRIDEEWFGLSFPEKCGDGFPYAGTDRLKLRATIDGYDLLWPASVDDHKPPSDGEVFDLIEFAYEFVAEPINPSFHSYMQHTHYGYDQESGRVKFAGDVNRIFERNGSAFEFRDGEIIRMAPGALHEALNAAVFRTGDAILDELLETARKKFLDRSSAVRQESLEKLWDAWERLKTVEAGKDKRQSVKVLLDKGATEPAFRALLETEAQALTAIGNDFMIRHTETSKTPIRESAHVDYLFHRMFALVDLLLKARET